MKVRCPIHDDAHPSCELYENGAYCFAGCGMIPLEQLGISQEVRVVPKEPEDIAPKMLYIQHLPQQYHRGMSFPTDEHGFYITWPDGNYYKYRWLEKNRKPKYLCPKHLPQPPFWARRRGSQTLLLVEGELEALSAVSAAPEWDILSPGGVSSFKKCLTLIRPYVNVILAVDNDKAGLKAAQEIGFLIKQREPGIRLTIIFKNKEQDFNDLLVQGGTNKVREEIARLLKEVQGASR